MRIIAALSLIRDEDTTWSDGTTSSGKVLWFVNTSIWKKLPGNFLMYQDHNERATSAFDTLQDVNENYSR